MSQSGRTEHEIHSTIRTALVYSGFLAIKAESRGEDLAEEIERELGPSLKRPLESQAEEVLLRYRNDLLASGIIAAIEKKLSEALGESKRTKWVLFASQTVGLAGAVALLKDYTKLPVEATYLLGLYSIAVLISIGLAIFRLR